MTAIRVVFDGTNFVPQQPVTLAAESEAVVIVEQDDPGARNALDAEICAYYQDGFASSDTDDEAWAKATSPLSAKAWDED